MARNQKSPATFAIVGLLGVLQLSGCHREEFRVVAQAVPGTGALQLWTCSDERVDLSTGESDRSTWSPGGTIPLEVDAVLAAVDRKGHIQWNSVGRGSIGSISANKIGVLWATIVLEDETERHALVLKKDPGGAEWQRINSPPHVFAGAPGVERRGYLWNERTAFHTNDAGATWTAIPLDPVTIRRATTMWQPAIDVGGDLLVPAQVGPSGAVGSIFKANERGIVKRGNRWQWPGEEVRAIKSNGVGALIIALAPHGGMGARVLNLEMKAGEQRELWSASDGSIGELDARGSRIAMLVVESGAPSHFLGTWKRTLFVSDDNGQNWKRRDVTAEAISSICVSTSGIWAASTANRRVYWIAR